MANIWNSMFEQGMIGLKSALNYLYAWTPQILFAILFVIAGILVGNFIKWAFVKAAKITKLSELSKKTGTDNALRKVGYKGTTPGFMGDVFKWTAYVLFFAGALQILFGSEFLSNTISMITVYAPKVIAAVIILVGGLIVSDILGKMTGKLVQGVVIKTSTKTTMVLLSETITKLMIFSVAVIISLAMIGVYVEILTIGFGIVFLGIILLFLVGARDLIPNFFAGIYLQSSNRIHKGMDIEFKKARGRIVEIGTLFTVLKTSKGEIQIPNNELMKSVTFVLE